MSLGSRNYRALKSRVGVIWKQATFIAYHQPMLGGFEFLDPHDKRSELAFTGGFAFDIAF